MEQELLDLLKSIDAKLDALKGFLIGPPVPVTAVETIISTPFGKYKRNAVTGKLEPVGLGMPEVTTPVEPIPAPTGMGYLPAYNLYPWPGVDYGEIPVCKAGEHVEYDYNNNTAVCLKDCGKLGG